MPRPFLESRLLCMVLVSLLYLPLAWNSAFAQSTGAISGRVTSLKTGLGVFGANVSAVGPCQKGTTTDSQGYYTISGLAPGPYNIVASASSYVNKSFSSFIFPTGTTPLNFQLNIRSIKGRVYDASTPTLALGEANITIGGNSVLCNADGYYEWLDMSTGTYTLTASAPGYADQSQQVEVTVGSTATVDFGLDPIAPGRIAGTITDSTTRDGLPGATVRVRRGTFEKTGNTDLNGQYSIENVPAWPYWTVDAYRLGYIAQTVSASVQSATTTPLSFALVPYGNISGTIEDSYTNQPIEGAIVTAATYLTTTNSNGYYTMFVAAETYTVTASAPGYSLSSESNVKVSAGKTTTVNLQIHPIPPGNIIGRVADAETDLGIAYAIVTADGHSNSTDVIGNYILSDVPTWSYTIEVYAPGFIGDSTQRSVPSGGSVTADFVLNPDTRVGLEPHLSFGNPGESFSIDFLLSESRFVYSWEMYLWWNPALLDASSMSEGDFLKGTYANRTTDFSFDEYTNEGVIHAKCLSTLSTPDNGVSGSGTLATLTLQIKAKGSCSINITSAMLFSPPPSMPTFLTAMDSAIFRTLQSDVNNDGMVSNLDLGLLGEAYGSTPNSSRWSASSDVNRDRKINALDLHKIGKDYGRSA